MSRYDEAFERAWQAGGPPGALAFLRDLFHHDDNQHVRGEPTDYLHDDEDDAKKTVTPAVGFDRMVSLFAPKKIEERVAFVLGRLVEDRTPEQDESHRFQPFNAFRLEVSTYGQGSAVIDSIHYDEATRAYRPQYGLNHDILQEEDNYDPRDEDDDSYDFIYALENKDTYRLTFEGEAVDGKTLYRDVRAAQYGAWARELVDRLWRESAFADFPKRLPFRVLVDTKAGWGLEGTLARVLEACVIDEAALEGHPLRERHLASAKPPAAIDPRDRFLHLVKDRAAFAKGTPDLAALVRENEEIATAARELAEHALDASSPLGPLASKANTPIRARGFARLLWATDPDAARAYVRRIFAAPIPKLPHQDIDESLAPARPWLDVLYGAWDDVPIEERESLAPAFEDARARIRANEHPILRLLAMERDLALEYGDDVVNEGMGSFELEAPVPEGYVETLAECVAEMPDDFGSYGDAWSFVTSRAEGLGEKAHALEKPLLEKLDAYCKDRRDGGQLVTNFARVLHAIKVAEPPPLVREYVEKTQYHNVDFYAAWAQGAIDAAWNGLVAAFEEDATAFAKPAAWEPHMPASDQGRKIFCERIASNERIDDLLAKMKDAVGSKPGPLLAALALALAKSFTKKVDAKSLRPLERAAAILSAFAKLDEEDATLLRRIRMMLVRCALDEKRAGAEEELARLVAAYPKSPMSAFFEAELALARKGVKAAGSRALRAVRAAAKNDLVYRKAMTAYAEDDGFLAFRFADARFRHANYTEGRFTGGLGAFDRDPFYDGLVDVGKDDAKRAKSVVEARAFVALERDLRTSPLPELTKRLDRNDFATSWPIAQRLMTAPGAYTKPLAALYDWFRGDEAQRLVVATALWDVPVLQRALLREPTFQKDLPWFFDAYRGKTANDLARTAYETLLELGLPEVVLTTADASPETSFHCFLSVNKSIQMLRAYERGADLLQRMLDKTKPTKPDYVLLASNLAVMNVMQKKLPEAEAVLDKLFAMDWSRFDYKRTDRDEMMEKILGGNLDEQISGVFRHYFAMAKYNAACIYGLTGRAELATTALRDAWTTHGPQVNAAKVNAEHDFDAVRDHADFRSLVADLERSAP